MLDECVAVDASVCRTRSARYLLHFWSIDRAPRKRHSRRQKSHPEMYRKFAENYVPCTAQRLVDYSLTTQASNDRGGRLATRTLALDERRSIQAGRNCCVSGVRAASRAVH
jgi:hypothetical protein